MSTPQHSIRAGDSDQCAERRPGRTTGFGAGRLPCVLHSGHDVRHRDALGRTWAETDVPEGPHSEAAREAGCHGMTTPGGGAAEATALTERLTELLAVRGNAAKMRHALRVADQAFDALHEHLRGGGALPRGWTPGKGTDGQGYTTAWFDALSETLRDPGSRPTLRATANAAEVAWYALDAALQAGKPMPEPWDGRRR